MARIILIITLLLTLHSITMATDLITIRELFYRASKSSAAADTLFETLKKVDASAPAVLMGYKGMACLMSCYHSYNPYTKLKYFFSGKELLESAIKREPFNIELRFLRFTVQLNAPVFLAYSADVEEDKKIILDGVKTIGDTDLQKRITTYILSSKKITDAEKSKIR